MEDLSKSVENELMAARTSIGRSKRRTSIPSSAYRKKAQRVNNVEFYADQTITRVPEDKPDANEKRPNQALHPLRDQYNNMHHLTLTDYSENRSTANTCSNNYSRCAQELSKDTHWTELVNKGDATCTTDELLTTISQYITTELKIEAKLDQVVDIRTEAKTPQNGKRRQAHAVQPRSSISRRHIFYCETTGHSPTDCQKIKTEKEGVQFLGTHNRFCNCQKIKTEKEGVQFLGTHNRFCNCGSGRQQTPNCLEAYIIYAAIMGITLICRKQNAAGQRQAYLYESNRDGKSKAITELPIIT
ncbi:hypothetical protein KIN20_020112 [Parelaphostrongylus tenuis]|uniref:Uncharacterized protein n=1 Tax=Parelaphostrongylus tenuis TaxID=148309 RepID=A0AAD5QQL1_PARTN|nr:hypothetical protein KIN20_020112 [Parelaphostrongylus tenuis]